MSKYDPLGSGHLQGNGRRQKKASIKNINLSDTFRIRQEVGNYDPNLTYTSRELLLLAEKILLDDPKPKDEEPAILLASHLLSRSKREIYVADGVPKPHVQSGLYWRTHPEGRKWRDAKTRKANSASFYHD